MIESLSIASLVLDPDIQCRAQFNDDAIKSYALDLKDGADLPPITVFHDGEVYRVADGFHRVRAFKKAGLDTIEAEIRKGDKRDAILHSVGCNATHGLRRTNKDKRRAIEMLLSDKEWAEWADRAIAEQCGVAPNTVAAHRKRLSAQIAQIDPPTTRTVKRGNTTYKQKTENIGKPKVSPEHPSDPPAPDPPHLDGDAGYCVYQALRHLRKIAISDDQRAPALRKVRNWIDQELAKIEAKESEENEGFALANSGHQSDG